MPKYGKLVKRSVRLGCHETSVALEQDFWDVLQARCRQRGVQLNAWLAREDLLRDEYVSLAAHLRLVALRWALAQRFTPSETTENSGLQLPGSEIA